MIVWIIIRIEFQRRFFKKKFICNFILNVLKRYRCFIIFKSNLNWNHLKKIYFECDFRKKVLADKINSNAWVATSRFSIENVWVFLNSRDYSFSCLPLKKTNNFKDYLIASFGRTASVFLYSVYFYHCHVLREN